MTPSRYIPTRALRRRPDLDQLKRQAKELLRAYAAGEADAVAEVAARYPGADPAAFALHEAQLVLARSYGFESWTRLKSYVDGVTVRRLFEAVTAGDEQAASAMLEKRPELVNFDLTENDERRALHAAVLGRRPRLVRLLMRHGADARQGVYPYRAATGALTIARERGDLEIVQIIDEEEQRRRSARPDTATSAPAGIEDDLVDAICQGQRDRAIAAMEADPTLIRAVDRRGCGPLHAAAATLDEPLVTWLLERGADANQPGPEGRPPLDVMAGRGWRGAVGLEAYAPIVARLREHGAVLTLRAAVALGDVEWIRRKHAEAAIENRIDGSGGLLTEAVRHDRVDMLALLLDLGLDPDERSQVAGVEEPLLSWGLPLHHCAGLGKLRMAEMLLERGADPNGQVYCSGSVMFSAYSARDWKMVELLERHGGFIDAASAGHLRLTAHARRMLEDEDAGRLREGSFMAVNGSLAEELLWAGLRGGDPEIVRMALERVQWPRDDGRWYGKLWSPLPEAGRSEEDHQLFLACFRCVLERCDPDVRHPKFNRNVLHDLAACDASAEPHAAEFAAAVLAAGARCDVRDALLGSTPLGWACRWGRTGIAALLIDHGADPSEPDAAPWATPWAWAERMNRTSILDLLRDRGIKERTGG